jgi:predicted lipid-binding transport protein (Tim44 family)
MSQFLLWKGEQDMLFGKWIKTGVILSAILFFSAGVLELDAYARVGGGSSLGSRGSRSYSSPSRPVSPSPAQPSPQMNRPMQPSPVQQPSMWRSMAYGALGGMVGGMLFSGLSQGFGGGGGFGGSGIGVIEILLIGLLLYGLYRFFRKKKEEEAVTGAYARTGMDQTAGQAAYGAAGQDQENPVDAGIAYIRQMDPSFDERRFTDLCTDLFFRIQGAWINRDLSATRSILTEEMYGILQGEADKLKADKKINKLDNIAVRNVEMTEVWQESGKDFITVKFLANLVDYTVSESGELLDGSKTEPVKFEEYWTFTRPVGNNPWQLSAINQP